MQQLQVIKQTIAVLSLAILSITPSSLEAREPNGTSFTYQGQLLEGDNLATGIFDIQIGIFDSIEPDSPLASLDFCAVEVTKGLFTLQLDFGEVFEGERRWLQIGIAPAGPCDNTTTYDEISPLQEVNPTPYSLHSSLSDSALIAEDSRLLDGKDSTEFLLLTGGTLEGPLSLDDDLCLADICRNSWLWSQDSAGAVSYTGGPVGIGIGTPSAALDVAGSISASGTICDSSGCLGDSAGADGHSLDAVDGSPIDAVFVNQSGQVGIGTTTPTEELSIQGDVSASGTVCDAVGCIGTADWSNITNRPSTFPPSAIRVGDFRIFGRLDVDGDLTMKGNFRLGTSGEPNPEFHLGHLLKMETFFQDTSRIDLYGYEDGTRRDGIRLEADQDSGGEIIVFDSQPTTVPNTINKTVVIEGRDGSRGGLISIRDGLRNEPTIELSGYDTTGPVNTATMRIRGNIYIEKDGGSGGTILTDQLILSNFLQLDVVAGQPSSVRCNANTHYGRMVADPVAGVLYVCMATGWVAK